MIPLNGYSDHALKPISFDLCPLVFSPYTSGSILGTIAFSLLLLCVNRTRNILLGFIYIFKSIENVNLILISCMLYSKFEPMHV